MSFLSVSGLEQGEDAQLVALRRLGGASADIPNVDPSLSWLENAQVFTDTSAFHPVKQQNSSHNDNNNTPTRAVHKGNTQSAQRHSSSSISEPVTGNLQKSPSSSLAGRRSSSSSSRGGEAVRPNLLLQAALKAGGPTRFDEDPFEKDAEGSKPRKHHQEGREDTEGGQRDSASRKKTISFESSAPGRNTTSVSSATTVKKKPLVDHRISLRDDGVLQRHQQQQQQQQELLHPSPSSHSSLASSPPSPANLVVSASTSSYKADNPVLSEQDEVFLPVQEFTHPKLRRALTDLLHVEKLTPVQRLSWAAMKNPEVDVMIRSETGSGKTLAYALPLLHELLTQCEAQPIKRDAAGTLLIVMCPTRELVIQVTETLTLLLRHALFLTVGGIHGGESRHKEKARLRKGLPVLITTPGRLLDHLRSTAAFQVHDLRAVVMDEADRLLDMGFEKPIREIMALLEQMVGRPSSGNTARSVPATWKRVLVSATITDAVERLSHFALRPQVIRVGETEDTFTIPATLQQHYVCVPLKHRLSALMSFLRSQLDAGARKIAVFVSTADSAEFLYYLLSRLPNPFLKSRRSGMDPGMDGRAERKSRRTASGQSVRKMVELANQHLQKGIHASDSEEEDEQVVTFDASDDSEEEETVNARSKIASGSGSNSQDLFQANIFKLHGNMPQVDRAAVFHAFKHGMTSRGAGENRVALHYPKSVLFCTDVAARGLDMPDIDWIVHYDPPVDPTSYIHRIGRTARIGRSGDSILFLSPHEEEYAAYLTQFLRSKNSPTTPPSPTSQQDEEEHQKDGTTEAALPCIQKKAYETLLYYLMKLDAYADHRSMFNSAATLERAITHLVMRVDKSKRWSSKQLRSRRSSLQRNGGDNNDDNEEEEEAKRQDGTGSGDQHLGRMALFAYQSYLRAYAAIPKEVRFRFFDSRALHLGHVAQSFGIDKSPAEVQQQLRSYIRDDRELARDASLRSRPSSSTKTDFNSPGTNGNVDGAAAEEDDDDDGDDAPHGGGSAALEVLGTRGNNQRRRQRVEVYEENRYRSTLVQKQRKRTRDWMEKRREEDGPRVKPLKFTEFDA